MGESVLQQKVAYEGRPISARKLQETIAAERGSQAKRLEELEGMRGQNLTLQKALGGELDRLRSISEQLAGGAEEQGFWGKVKALFGGEAQAPQSVEALLREQYAISTRRLTEAADFADRLEAAEQDLYDEMERLNLMVIESARNEELAAEVLLELEAHRRDLKARLPSAEGSAQRSLQAELDVVARQLSEHSTKLKLYATAEERLAVLKESTSELAKTIGHLRSDISQYVTAASHKLDLVGGQITAVGTAADASVVMLELRQALDAMGESLHHTTRFVSETQRYFRENLGQLMDDLEVYDADTREALRRNRAEAELAEEMRVEEALELAARKRGERERSL